MDNAAHIHLPKPYVSVSLESRGAGWSAEPHAHPIFQIIYITQGSLVLTHNNMDYHLRKAHLYIIPPEQSHSLRTETGFHQLGIGVAADKDARGIASLLKTRVKAFTVLDHVDFLSTIPELWERLQHYSLLSQLKIASLLDIMLLTCMEMMEGNNSFRTKLLAQLEFHLSGNLRLYDIAQRMSFSQTHLERLTGEEFGCSVMELFRRLKLNRACSLLIHSTMGIEQIAESLGFCDQAYFSRFFKQRMKITPTKYRKANNFWLAYDSSFGHQKKDSQYSKE